MFNKIENRQQQFRGQSIVEAIIATSIIATAVASALTLTTAALNAQKDNEGWMVATNLAREGVEVVRNIRDSNWLADLDWDEGLVGEDLDYTAVAMFDPVQGSWELEFGPDALGDSGTEIWRYVAGPVGSYTGIYTQNLNQPTDTIASPFRRLITLNGICSGHTEISDVAPDITSGLSCPIGKPKVAIIVRSKVSWSSGGRDREIEVVETIYDWR